MTEVTAEKEVWLRGQVQKTVTISLTDDKVIDRRQLVASWALPAAAFVKHSNNMWW